MLLQYSIERTIHLSLSLALYLSLRRLCLPPIWPQLLHVRYCCCCIRVHLFIVRWCSLCCFSLFFCYFMPIFLLSSSVMQTYFFRFQLLGVCIVAVARALSSGCCYCFLFSVSLVAYKLMYKCKLNDLNDLLYIFFSFCMCTISILGMYFCIQTFDLSA